MSASDDVRQPPAEPSIVPPPAAPPPPIAPPPPPAVDVVFRFTLWDVFRASADAARYSWLAAIFGFLFVYGTFFSVMQLDAIAFAFLVVGFGFSTGWLSALFVVLQVSRRRDLLDREHVLHADREGITWVSPGSSSRAAWSVYRQVREMRSDFLLDPGTGSSTFIPKRALAPSTAETFRQLAGQAGLLTEGSSWIRPVIGYAVGVGACVLLYMGTSMALNG